MGYEGVGGHVLDHLGIDLSRPIQQLKRDAFICGSPAPTPLALPAERGFVLFNLARECTDQAFQFGNVEPRRTQILIDPIDDVGIDAQTMRQPRDGPADSPPAGWQFLV